MSEVYDYCYLVYVLVLIYLLGIMPSIFYLSIGLIASPLSQIIRRRKKSEMNDLFLTTVPIVQYIEVFPSTQTYFQTEKIENAEQESFITDDQWSLCVVK